MTGRTKNRRVRQEGAVMLVVMLVLLLTTATAIFAIHSTSTEIRGAGFYRQAMQTQFVADTGAVAGTAWVDKVGVQLTCDLLKRQAAGGTPGLDMRPMEPPTAPGKLAHRLYPSAFDVLTGESHLVEGATSLGPKVPYAPEVFVDMYDIAVETGSIAGMRSDGGSDLVMLNATYTSRGRTYVFDATSGSRITAASSGVANDRAFHETASDARIHGRSGPGLCPVN